jgi:hypothetical protein
MSETCYLPATPPLPRFRHYCLYLPDCRERRCLPQVYGGMKFPALRRISCELAAVLLSIGALALAGCAGGTRGATYPMYDPSYDTRVPDRPQPVYAEQPGPAGQPVYVAEPPPAAAQSAYGQSDYIYYPSAEAYYSPARQEYIYREGTRWTTRHDRPPELNTGLASIRIQLDDGPEHHHSEIKRKYPHDWQPPQNNERDRRRYRDGDER